jgi:23S rRNA pseudouridine1911/1915/1917 synthase
VNAEWTVAPAEAGARLDKFLAAADRLAARSRAVTALERGQVFLNGEETGPGEAGRVLREGDRVRLWQDRPGSHARHIHTRALADGVRIVFEDEELIVVDKPPGLLTVPLAARPDEPSVLDHLDAAYAARMRRAPLVVHRIDRDTSGLVAFARTPRALHVLKEQFLRREPERSYLAVVTGVPSPAAGTWRDHFIWNARETRLEPARPHAHDPLEALSRYEVLEAFAAAALLGVQLVTGRRNQVRAQASLHGHPLAGERQYLHAGVPALPFARQALHAHRLAFAHPATGARVAFESPLPRDLRQLTDRLRHGRANRRR